LPEVAAQVGLQVDAPPLKHRQCTLSLQTLKMRRIGFELLLLLL
jgi:hypothetical protein